jgi:predicted RNase H-like nuclease (RuvC/YqgF family)
VNNQISDILPMLSRIQEEMQMLQKTAESQRTEIRQLKRTSQAQQKEIRSLRKENEELNRRLLKYE